MVARRMINFPFMGWPHPFSEMERMAKQMDWLTSGIFGRPGASFFSARVFPAVNIKEDKEKYYVHAELPGIKADDVKLEVNGRNLTISGERKIHSENEKAKYHRKEREAGKFSRVITLPGEADATNVDAKLVNGLLTVAIGKPETARPKQIIVN